ncbi:MAG: tetratricopeptide repeat protein [Mycobacterium sp.]|nr:tetratricopeptide repeat protein [Mycobacterium sp.]
MFGRRSNRSAQVFPSDAAGRQAAAGGSAAEMARLGVLLKAHGRHDEAAEWFRDAADAGNVDGMANLAIYLMSQGRNAEAAEWFRRTGAPLGETLAKRLLRSVAHENGARNRQLQ